MPLPPEVVVDQQRFRRAKELLLRALEMEPAERVRWLDRACEGDAALRREIDSLLDQQDRPVRIVEEGVIGSAESGRLADAVDVLAGRPLPPSVGPYAIVGVLGEGGMGVVYHGRQRGAIERDVAVKVIRHGLNSAKVLARFEYERRSLARMDHPHIPSVLDAGSDARGRPYVVLPLVRGLPVTRFCDEQCLDLRSRLHLFLKICRAVEHAHGRGVLHRDLKPSNILVREVEGVATPAVIDFGIAKALDLETQEDLTLEGQRVGTPAYMSPEQLRWDAPDVDVRSDVYALGIILYELLTGRHPLGDRVEEATRAMAAGVEPPTFPAPSSAVESAADTEARAARRQVSGSRLRRALRGDLDIICLVATRADRTRRYPSVAHLVDDIERQLDGRTVLARPDSVRYRLSKYVRRHAVGVTMAVAAALLALAGTAFLAVHAERVGRERDRAVSAEAAARREASAASEISSFLQGLFTQLDPTDGSAADATAREILAAGADRVRTSLAHQPLVRARLHEEIGRVYHGIALHDEAIELLREGLVVLDSVDASGDAATVAFRRGTLEAALANALYDVGDHEAAEEHNRRAIDALRLAGEPGRSELGEALSYLATSLQAQGRLDEAETLLEESIRISVEVDGPLDPDAAWARGILGYVQYKRGDLRRAVESFEEVIEVQRAIFDGPHADLAGTLNNLAGMALELRDFDEAERIADEALRMYRSLYDADHPAVARALRLAGRVATERGALDRAGPLLEEAYRMDASLLGENHRNTTRTLSAIAGLELARGRFEAALAATDSVIARRVRALGADRPDVEEARRMRGEVLLEAGRFEEALAVLDRAVHEAFDRLGGRHPTTGGTWLQRARARLALGMVDGAREDLRRALPVLEATYGSADDRSVQARSLLEGIGVVAADR